MYCRAYIQPPSPQSNVTNLYQADVLDTHTATCLVLPCAVTVIECMNISTLVKVYIYVSTVTGGIPLLFTDCRRAVFMICLRVHIHLLYIQCTTLSSVEDVEPLLLSC